MALVVYCEPRSTLARGTAPRSPHRPDNDDVTDKQADHVFRMALRDSGVPVLRRWLMWNAVSLASLWRRGIGKVAVVLFAFHILAFTGALAAALIASWGWLGSALAYPFVWVWDLFLGTAASGVGSGVSWLWTAAEWALPASLEGPWWKVAIIGAAGLLVWRKRWLITLVGLALIALPTIAVFTSYALAFVADWTVHVLARVASVLPQIDVPEASKPEFGRPYRQGYGRM